MAFLLPALWDLLSTPARPYGYLAPDAFYYFTIAINWVEQGFPSFDQAHATNGFHPLWQWLVTALYWALHTTGYDRFALVPIAVIVNLLMLTASLALWGKALTQQGRVTNAIALLPVGPWPLLLAPLWWAFQSQLPAHRMTPLFGTYWNFANGMETSLTVLLYAAVAWQFVVGKPNSSARRALVFGASWAALSLARLDHAIFAIPFCAYGFLSPRWGTKPSHDHCHDPSYRWHMLGAWAAPLCLYLVYNKATLGHAFPVSGAVKSHFPQPSWDNFRQLGQFASAERRPLLYMLGRLGSIAFPGLVALVYLPFALRLQHSPWGGRLKLRQPGDKLSLFLALSAVGTIGLASYDLLFVISWHIGEWYAPVPLVFTSLVAITAMRNLGRTLRYRWGPRVGLYWGSGFLVFALVGLFPLHALKAWGAPYANFCLHQASRVVAHYGSHPPRLLSRDDGVIAFGTGFPTTSGTHLALDGEAMMAVKAGTFQTLLASRDIQRLTSLYYAGARGFRMTERSVRVQQFASSVLLETPEQQYQVEYVDGSFGILRAMETSN